MTEQAGIRETVLDYFEGWFEGDAARMERALHPELAKRSLEGDGFDHTTAAQMIEATARGVGTRWPPERRGVEIDIVDIHGPIATVVARGDVYHEYLHLTRTRAGWKIVNALWDWASPEG